MKKLLLVLFTSILILSCSKDDEQVLVTYNYTHSDSEIDLLNRINHYRDSIGIGQVSLVGHISYKCGEHNDYMITNNVVNHDYFYDRSTNIEKICHATKVGEIIAYNYQTNKSVLIAWMNSPCHDTVIKSEFKRIGISIKENPDHRKYYTVIFID